MKKLLCLLFIPGLLSAVDDSLFLAYQLKKGFENSVISRHLTKECWDSFFLGLNDSLPLKSKENKVLEDFLSCERRYLSGRNRQKANGWLNSKTEVVWIIPKKLGYRIIEEGNGQVLPLNVDSINVDYSIGKAGDIVEACGLRSCFNISELIPGMGRAVIGMKSGEVREIFIHPDFGYGDDSNYDPGVALRAKVRLHSFSLGNKDACIAQPFDSAKSYPNDTELSSLAQKAAYYYGRYCRRYIINGPVALDEVVKHLKCNRFEEVERLSSDQIEENIYRVHWKIIEVILAKQRKEAVFFLKNLKTAKEIVPGKVYLQGIINNDPSIREKYRLNLQINDVKGKILYSKKEKIIFPATTFPGLAAVLPYLKPHEPVTLYIHPDLGYKDSDSPLGGKLLITQIVLED